MSLLLPEKVDQVPRTDKSDKAKSDACQVADENVRQGKFYFAISEEVDALQTVC